jgi:antibiotic biosynthesis monooxygenase
MPEIFSIAVFEPLEGKEQEALEALRGLIRLLAEKKYSRDSLYRDRTSSRYLDVRYWTSEKARHDAHEDPQVHSYWARLGNLVRIEQVFETFDPVEV